mmetsp:Transcript_45966/g.120479  ORF Transcript_45966/g.120479 Transcript_45966/m.120479 type:complete len:104 (+) Transcript_45966:161-472(+)
MSWLYHDFTTRIPHSAHRQTSGPQPTSHFILARHALRRRSFDAAERAAVAAGDIGCWLACVLKHSLSEIIEIISVVEGHIRLEDHLLARSRDDCMLHHKVVVL